MGATLFVADSGTTQGHLPLLEPDQAETDSVCQIMSFYRMAVRLADMRGVDAEHPRHLTKITRTR